jgi:hypothetical protein
MQALDNKIIHVNLPVGFKGCLNPLELEVGDNELRWYPKIILYSLSLYICSRIDINEYL